MSTQTQFSTDEQKTLERAIGKLPYVPRIPEITDVDKMAEFLRQYAEAVKYASNEHAKTRAELSRLQRLVRSGGELLATMLAAAKPEEE